MLSLKEKKNGPDLGNMPLYLTSTTSEKKNGNFLVVWMEMRSLFIVYSAFVGITCGLNLILFFKQFIFCLLRQSFKSFFFLETFSYCNSVGEIKIVLNVFDLCLKWMSALKRKKSHF